MQRYRLWNNARASPSYHTWPLYGRPRTLTTVYIWNVEELMNGLIDIKNYFRYKYYVQFLELNYFYHESDTHSGVVRGTVPIDLYEPEGYHWILGKKVRIAFEKVPFYDDHQQRSLLLHQPSYKRGPSHRQHRRSRNQPISRSFVDELFNEHIPVMDRISSNSAHRQTCPLSKLVDDCWLQVLKHLSMVDCLNFQNVCTCAKRVTDFFFHDNREQFCLSYTDLKVGVKPDRKLPMFSPIEYHHVMRILTRFELSDIVTLKIDLDQSNGMRLDTDFFVIIEKVCPNLKTLAIDSALFHSRQFESSSNPMKLETLILIGGNTNFVTVPPNLTKTTLVGVFNKMLLDLKTLHIKKFAPETEIFEMIPPDLENLKISSRFETFPTETIAKHAPNLKRLSMNVKSYGYDAQSKTHHHFLTFNNLEELKLKGYPFIREDDFLVSFAPRSLKRLRLSHTSLNAHEISLIIRQCPDLTFLSLDTDFEYALLSATNLEELVVKTDSYRSLVNRLPPNLKCLRLRKCCLVNKFDIRLLLEYIGNCLPLISTLDLRFDDYLDTDFITRCVRFFNSQGTLCIYYYERLEVRLLRN